VESDPVPGTRVDQIDIFLPRIMIGYNVEHPVVRLMPMAMFMAWSMNEDYMMFEPYDDISVAWLLSLTNELIFDQLKFRIHAHYGQNIGNMGFAGPTHTRMVGAFYSKHGHLSTLNTAHSVNLGGHFAVSYDFTERFNLNAGVGYATTDTSSERSVGRPEDYFYSHNDDRLAFYLQGVFKVNNFSVVPEFGMFQERKSKFGIEEGNKTYFGAQFRFDF